MHAAAACPACGAALAPWRSVPTSEPGLGATRFTLRRCVRCGTAVTVGEPLAEPHDSGAYRAGVPRLYRLVRPLLGGFDRQRLALLRELAPPPARLIDAGSGRGRFVLAAGRAGYDALGVEPSSRGATAAAASGSPVRHATIGAAAITPGSADAVTVWHVLEHLEDPGAAVSEVATWLRPGGTVLVGVPNLASLQARIGGERWYHLDVPRHRVHFTLAGVRALLERHGFAVVRVDHLLAEQNPYGMWQSLLNRVTEHPSYLYNLLKRNAPLRSPDLAITLAAVPLAPFAALLEVLAAIAGRGGTVAVLARRAP